MSEPTHEGRANFQLVPPTVDDGSSPIFYSNFIQATPSPLDVTLQFGWYAIPPISDTPEGPVPVPIRQVAKVTIPLPIVRALIQLLERQLEAWQDAFGQEVPDQPQQADERQGVSE